MKTPYEVKAGPPRKAGSTFYLWLIAVSLAAYSYLSLSQGMLTGNYEANRQMVYVVLGFLMLLMAIPVFFGPPLPSGTLISRCLWALFAWVLLVDVLQGSDRWTIAVRVGLSLWWPITYIFTARLAFRNERARQLFPRIMIVFFVFFCFMTLIAVTLIEQRSNREHGVAGVAYHPLSASPFIFLIEQSWAVRFSLMGLGVFSVVYSSKRGAVLATAGIFLAAAFVYVRSGLLQPRKLVAILMVPLVSALIVWYLNRASDGFLLSRFGKEQITEGSGRVDIWEEVLGAIQEGSLTRKLFGGGSNATLSLVGTGSHNEWLEFQNCYGVVGVMLLAVLLGAIAATAYRYFRAGKSDWAAAVLSVFVLSFAQTIYSGWYFVHSTFFGIAVLGYTRGLELLDGKKVTASLGQLSEAKQI